MTDRPSGFLASIYGAHRDSLLFLLACPLLAAVPVVVEMIQHVAEVKLGMYDSLAAAKAADAHPLRMAFGFAKTLALALAGYWVVRWMAWRDPALAGRCVEAKACMYTNTPDLHFVISAHPEHANVAVAAGFSGHGYKFCSVVGEILADLALEGRTDHPTGLFSPERLR